MYKIFLSHEKFKEILPYYVTGEEFESYDLTSLAQDLFHKLVENGEVLITVKDWTKSTTEQMLNNLERDHLFEATEI